jgi:glycosyltransferase involved in cell wall biosynthesis
MAKIICLSHIFPPAVDGGSRVIYKLGQYFQKQNNQVLYISSDCFSTDDFTKTKYLKSKKLAPDQLKLLVYHHLRRPLKFINLLLPKKSYPYQLLQTLQKGPVFKLLPFLKTTVQIIKFKPNLIIAGPLPTTIVLYANFLKKITKSKLLINASFHTTDFDFHYLPLIKTLQKSDYLWTLTKFETNYFIKNFKINPNKIILAGNGIDESFLIKKNKPYLTNKVSLFKGKTGLPGKGFNILFIGSLSAHKGLSTLIQSFSSLLSNQLFNYSTIQLTIAGQKTLYYPQIKKQINNLPKNIKSKIKFIFNFPQDKLSQIIDSCDILVLPSKQESFGLVLIESWARQKPVIVSNIPSLSEIVKKTQGGLIFKLDNPIDLAQKISKLLKNPKLNYQLGQNGFNYVKNNYTWEKVGQKLKEKILLS